MRKIIVVTGQTAVGKTNLAIKIAAEENGELVNCDSRQAYKYLDLVTGKDISQDQFQLVNRINSFDIGYYKIEKSTPKTNYLTKIWLYDIVSPNQYFSSFDYKQCALFVIKKLLEENKTPIIVGGTYFYLYHLLYGVASETIPPNWELRRKLETKTVKELQDFLQKLDPQSFSRLNESDRANPRRLLRKIEILTSQVKKPINKFFDRKPQITLFKNLGLPNINIKLLGLKFASKEKLKEAIAKRVEERLKNGAIDEVKKLLDLGYSENDPGLKTIGCRQIIDFLKGKITKKNMIETWINKEIQYAKRQYTFMKKDIYIQWKAI